MAKKTNLQDENSQAYHAQDMVCAKNICKAIQGAQKRVSNDIDLLLQSFAYKGGFSSVKEAQKYLDKPLTQQGKSLLWSKAKSLGGKLAEKWLTRLGKESTKSAINMKKSLNLMLEMNEPAIAKAIQGEAKPFLKKTVTEAYGRQSFAVQKNLNIAFNVDMPTTAMATEIATNALPHSTTNKQASLVTEELREKVLEGILAGKPLMDIVEDIQTVSTMQMWQSKRLVRTMMTDASAQAELKALKDAEFDEFEFTATKDEKTCPHCGKLDGKVFPLTSAVSGRNCPPIHPNCRCVVMAPLDDFDKSIITKAARDENGNNITIPATWTYEDWAKQYYPKGYEALKKPLKPMKETPVVMPEKPKEQPKWEWPTPEYIESKEAHVFYAKSSWGYYQAFGGHEALMDVQGDIANIFAAEGKNYEYWKLTIPKIGDSGFKYVMNHELKGIPAEEHERLLREMKVLDESEIFALLKELGVITEEPRAVSKPEPKPEEWIWPENKIMGTKEELFESIGYNWEYYLEDKDTISLNYIQRLISDVIGLKGDWKSYWEAYWPTADSISKEGLAKYKEMPKEMVEYLETKPKLTEEEIRNILLSWGIIKEAEEPEPKSEEWEWPDPNPMFSSKDSASFMFVESYADALQDMFSLKALQKVLAEVAYYVYDEKTYWTLYVPAAGEEEKEHIREMFEGNDIPPDEYEFMFEKELYTLKQMLTAAKSMGVDIPRELQEPEKKEEEDKGWKWPKPQSIPSLSSELEFIKETYQKYLETGDEDLGANLQVGLAGVAAIKGKYEWYWQLYYPVLGGSNEKKYLIENGVPKEDVDNLDNITYLSMEEALEIAKELGVNPEEAALDNEVYRKAKQKYYENSLDYLKTQKASGAAIYNITTTALNGRLDYMLIKTGIVGENDKDLLYGSSFSNYSESFFKKYVKYIRKDLYRSTTGEYSDKIYTQRGLARLSNEYWDKFTDEQKSALSSFTGSGYDGINAVGRGTATQAEHYIDNADLMAEAISSVTTPAMTLFRGVKYASSTFSIKDAEGLKVGQRYLMGEFASYSLSYEIANGFRSGHPWPEGLVMKVQFPAGTGLCYPVLNHSNFPREQEVIAQRDHIIECTAIDDTIEWNGKREKVVSFKMIVAE